MGSEDAIATVIPINHLPNIIASWDQINPMHTLAAPNTVYTQNLWLWIHAIEVLLGNGWIFAIRSQMFPEVCTPATNERNRHTFKRMVS